MKEKKLSKQLFYFYDVLFDMKKSMCDAFFAEKNKIKRPARSPNRRHKHHILFDFYFSLARCTVYIQFRNQFL